MVHGLGTFRRDLTWRLFALALSLCVVCYTVLTMKHETTEVLEYIKYQCLYMNKRDASCVRTTLLYMPGIE